MEAASRPTTVRPSEAGPAEAVRSPEVVGRRWTYGSSLAMSVGRRRRTAEMMVRIPTAPTRPASPPANVTFIGVIAESSPPREGAPGAA